VTRLTGSDLRVRGRGVVLALARLKEDDRAENGRRKPRCQRGPGIAADHVEHPDGRDTGTPGDVDHPGKNRAYPGDADAAFALVGSLCVVFVPVDLRCVDEIAAVAILIHPFDES
jgi:hypothetical protein